jgi:hypothetical protein
MPHKKPSEMTAFLLFCPLCVRRLKFTGTMPASQQIFPKKYQIIHDMACLDIKNTSIIKQLNLPL